MDIQIPELNILVNEINNLKTMLSIISQKNNDNSWVAEWYNDEQCWEKKGGMALSTYRTNRYYQCKGGVPDSYIGGRKVWHRDSVMEWIKIPDDELDNYHAKYKTGASKK
jgi:hypothetical protein